MQYMYFFLVIFSAIFGAAILLNELYWCVISRLCKGKKGKRKNNDG